ncbi:hypothetical protein HRbin17_01099 [bacterium HR17]|jgi:hypothetical protein|uniref:Uncharacterized protein n=1 Tax=Candidatus Fervidibacter japonicus TaxID=2035412 RepID=A0A2H5XBN7_9BACT|nr:hypothetical protein HRbin17_01099 [bacterium HR17]
MFRRLGVVSIVTGLLVAGLHAAPYPMPVLCLGVADRSGSRSNDYSAIVLQALTDALNRTGVFAVKVAEDPNLPKRLPLDAAELVAVGEAAKAPSVLQAVIANAVTRSERNGVTASLTLEAVRASVAAPRVIWKARAVAQGRGDHAPAAFARAAQTAAEEVARQLATAAQLRGQVLLPPAYTFLDPVHPAGRERFYAPTVRISLDLIVGLPVGAEVAIVRGNRPIAAGRVVEVDYGSSLVALTCWEPAERLQIGDVVTVTYLPQRSADLPLPLRKEKDFRRAERDFAVAAFIAGVAAAFVGE